MTAQPELRWTRPDWLAEAVAWIRARVEVTGEIEQPHVYWWSTVLRVPTASGDVWFKASHPSHGFEPALTLELASLRPQRLIEVLAVDLERGWMLSADAGTRLSELLDSADDLARWEEVLPLYAGDARLERMRDAYLEPFGGYGSRAELLAAFATAYRLGTISRALSRYRAVEAVPDLEPADSDSVPYGLKLFLKNGPIGTWK